MDDISQECADSRAQLALGCSLLRAAARDGLLAVGQGVVLLALAGVLFLCLLGQLVWSVTQVACPLASFVLRVAVVVALLMLPAAMEALLDLFFTR